LNLSLGLDSSGSLQNWGCFEDESVADPELSWWLAGIWILARIQSDNTDSRNEKGGDDNMELHFVEKLGDYSGA
jgi:hypothetical protein